MSDDHDHCDHDPIECTYDALVAEHREAVAERDRLRAVVDLVAEYRRQHGRFWLLENNEDEAVAAAERESQAWSEVVAALDLLDVSADIDRPTCPDCGNPLRFCDCPKPVG